MECIHNKDEENFKNAGIAQLARASAFQAEGRGFESRFPLQIDFVSLFGGPRSSVVEHFLGKEEVPGSSPGVGSTLLNGVCIGSLEGL